jgi:hypothetical protein
LLILNSAFSIYCPKKLSWVPAVGNQEETWLVLESIKQILLIGKYEYSLFKPMPLFIGTKHLGY